MFTAGIQGTCTLKSLIELLYSRHYATQ